MCTMAASNNAKYSTQCHLLRSKVIFIVSKFIWLHRKIKSAMVAAILFCRNYLREHMHSANPAELVVEKSLHSAPSFMRFH